MNKTIHIKNEIVIKNLSKNFENNIIFKDLCLNIPTGQSVGIMGPSGTGKSILLKCILGLIEYEGEIYYKDKLHFLPQPSKKLDMLSNQTERESRTTFGHLVL